MSGSTRELREGRYGSWIEGYREIDRVATDVYSHSNEVLLYCIRLKQFVIQNLTPKFS
jgi:hypothetical protein